MRLVVFLCSIILFIGFLQAQQKIESIDGFASLVGMRAVVVTPVNRSETTLLIEGGAIDTDGYTGLVVNIAGQTEATISKPGVIGAVLIPDIAPYDYAFKTLGLLPSISEVTIPIETGQQFFIAKQTKFDVGFPRYRVVFYNTSDATVRLSFFAYRTKD